MISTIDVKDIVYESFQDYKCASMLIATCTCNWKCLIELGLDTSMCQNCQLAKSKTSSVKIDVLYESYINSKITNAIVFGGLEPFLQFEQVVAFIDFFRKHDCYDDIVIYTGYYPHEVDTQINVLKQYKNIIIKFGRFIPGREGRFDDILGIYLASNNQYAAKIS